MSPSSPIAVVDSGLAGLSVVRALRELLPGEEVVYLGDTGRGGYANRSQELIEEMSLQLVEQLRLFRPKHVAIACNVMAGLALTALRSKFPDFGISGIIDAAARTATEMAGARDMPLIGVLASEATIRSKAYERSIHRRRHHARLLLRPAPMLEALAEEGRQENDLLLRLAVKQYVGPIANRGVHLVIMGSAWHSLLVPQVQRVVGDQVGVVDSARACAQDVARRLQANGLLRGGDPSGALHVLLTDQTPRYPFLAQRLLGGNVESPKVIPLKELYRETETGPMRVSA